MLHNNFVWLDHVLMIKIKLESQMKNFSKDQTGSNFTSIRTTPIYTTSQQHLTIDNLSSTLC
jgi:hypothetical protein